MSATTVTRGAGTVRPARSRAARVLVALTLLFALRVAGQALVAVVEVAWLPPMDAWNSGLLPYRVLLPAQLGILTVQVWLDRRVSRGTWSPQPRTARALRWFSYLYAAVMLLRLVLTGTHVIPIVFHWVLAAYIYTLAEVSGGRTPRAAGR